MKKREAHSGGKKILFVGSTKGPSTSLYYFTNLVKLGHTVYPYDPDYYATPSLREKLIFRVTKNPAADRVARVHAELVGLCRDNRFDLVFVMAENFLAAKTIAEMKRSARVPPTFVYHSHDNNFSPGILKPKNFEQTLLAYDYLFTTKSQNVARYEALGHRNAHFLASAFEPTIHHPIPPERSAYSGRQFDVAFIGTYDRSRDALLGAVGWERLSVWGNNWEKFSGYRTYREQIHPKAISYFEYSDVISRSRIVLGLLREEAEDRHTQRTFEIPACGALQIAPRNEEILTYFTENREIVCFSDEKELKEKCDYYLAHPEKAAAIAKRGYERCLADGHTYADRLQAMLGRIYPQRLKAVGKK